MGGTLNNQFNGVVSRLNFLEILTFLYYKQCHL